MVNVLPKWNRMNIYPQNDIAFIYPYHAELGYPVLKTM